MPVMVSVCPANRRISSPASRSHKTTMYPENGFQIMDKRLDIVEDSVPGPSFGCLPNKISGGKEKKSYGTVGQASMCR